MNRVVADYNRMTTLRRHRVDSQRKNMIFNLQLVLFELKNIENHIAAWHASLSHCEASVPRTTPNIATCSLR